MSFRVRDRLVVADVVTMCNAALGVAAMVAAITEGPGLAARLILLAAVADGLDGIVAREFGDSEVGLTLDSMADVVSFGTAPAILVFAIARDAWAPLASSTPQYALAVAVPALFAVLALLRAAFYTVYFETDTTRPGIQNTLAASILAAGYLAVGDAGDPATVASVVLAATVLFAFLMLAPVPYPKLDTRDAVAMGFVQMGAILVPSVASRAFPRVLLGAAVVYMLLAPRYYWA